MYKHFSLLALVAALVLAACSSDDDLDAAATSDSDASSTYMAVNIYMSSDAATRSTSTVEGGTYATGTETEYAIDLTKSIFLFYASDGSYLTSALPTETGTASSTTSSTEDYAEYTTSAMLVLSPTTLTPANMVGILNDAKYESYKGMSLTELQEALFTSSNDDGTNLLMSNAVKYEDNSFSFATSISSSDIYDEDNDALDNPVDMYVERAKARVAIGVSSANFGDANTNGTYTYTLQDEDENESGTTTSTDRTFTYYYVDATNGLSYTDATVDITINGWAVNAYNQTGYVIKNYSNGSTELSSDITGTNDAPGGAWGENWYSDLRIFWAVDGNYDDDGDESDTDWALQYYSWDDLAGETDPLGCSTDAAYYYEQTLDPNATTGYNDGQTAYAPTLLVAATVGVNAGDGVSEAEDAGDDIFLSYGEVLYSESAVYAKILEIIKGIDGINLSDDETISSITWTTKEASKGTVIIESIEMSGSSDVSSYISTINNNDFISNGTSEEEATAYYLRKYDGGASYYQVPIQTYITSSSSPYGLVRNTAYSITINSVTGIGAGVPDKSTDLTEIPEEDETGHLAAKINILAWRLSSQSVDL